MKIIVIRACAVGDFVLNLPALEAFQESQSDVEFTLIGYPSTLQIARDFVNVSSVRSIELEPWKQLFHAPMPGLDFERAIVWMKDGAIAENLRRSGVSNVLRADPFPKAGHAARHLLQTLNLPAPKLPDKWHPESDQIILHPGSGSRVKCWPHFRQLASQLASGTFLIGPAEPDFDSGRHRRLENLSLREVAELLRTCRAFVGNDSGITHLAAYLGVPTVAIFGPTDPNVWGPLGRRVSVLTMPKIASLSVEAVLRTLSEISGPRNPSGSMTGCNS